MINAFLAVVWMRRVPYVAVVISKDTQMKEEYAGIEILNYKGSPALHPRCEKGKKSMGRILKDDVTVKASKEKQNSKDRENIQRKCRREKMPMVVIKGHREDHISWIPIAQYDAWPVGNKREILV